MPQNYEYAWESKLLFIRLAIPI